MEVFFVAPVPDEFFQGLCFLRDPLLLDLLEKARRCFFFFDPF